MGAVAYKNELKTESETMRLLQRQTAEKMYSSTRTRQVYWLHGSGTWITVVAAGGGYYTIAYYHDCPCGG